MRVTCESCSTEHDMEPPAWVETSGRAFRFRCADCGHSQMISSPNPTPEPPESPVEKPPTADGTIYLKQEGKVYLVQGWETLAQWVRESRIGPEDLISEGGVRWEHVNERPEVAHLFEALEGTAPEAPTRVADAGALPFDTADSPSGADAAPSPGRTPTIDNVLGGVSTGLPPLPVLHAPELDAQVSDPSPTPDSVDVSDVTIDDSYDEFDVLSHRSDDLPSDSGEFSAPDEADHGYLADDEDDGLTEELELDHTPILAERDEVPSTTELEAFSEPEEIDAPERASEPEEDAEPEQASEPEEDAQPEQTSEVDPESESETAKTVEDVFGDAPSDISSALDDDTLFREFESSATGKPAPYAGEEWHEPEQRSPWPWLGAAAITLAVLVAIVFWMVPREDDMQQGDPNLSTALTPGPQPIALPEPLNLGTDLAPAEGTDTDTTDAEPEDIDTEGTEGVVPDTDTEASTQATAAPEPSSVATPSPEPSSPAPPTRPEPTPPRIAPPSVSALVDAGWSKVDTGDIGAAASDFQSALRQRPASGDANFGFGYVLAEQGKLTEAKPYLCRAAENGRGSTATEARGVLSRLELSCD